VIEKLNALFRHAIDTPEIASVGDRDAQIINDPFVSIPEFHFCVLSYHLFLFLGNQVKVLLLPL
jgi:hypothetical protein